MAMLLLIYSVRVAIAVAVLGFVLRILRGKP
jgi:hypothetical protein